ncbi:MAG: AI-2E family transporter [Acidobacteriota bacterium]
MAEGRRLILFGIVATILAGLLLYTLVQVRSTLLVIYVSALFAMGLSPLVQLVERQRVVPIGTRRVPRWLAILVVYLAVLLIVGGILAMILPPLVEQGRQLWLTLPERLDRLQGYLMAWGLVQEPVTVKDLLQRAPAGSADAVTTVLTAVWGFAGGLFGLATTLILTFYMLVDSKGIFEVFLRLFPEERRPRVAVLSASITDKISGWLGGQALLSGTIGLTTWLALSLLGVPYSSVLAVVAAVGEAIPIVGPVLAAIPAVLVAFSVSPALAVAVTVFFVAQQQLENAVLVPRIMERQVGVSAIVVIVALAVGAELLGLVGALLAVPTAAIVQVIFEELVLSNGQT